MEALSYVTLKSFIGKMHSANNCFEHGITYSQKNCAFKSFRCYESLKINIFYIKNDEIILVLAILTFFNMHIKK